MKKILKSWITWAIVVVACSVTACFIDFNNEQVPVETTEVIKVDSTEVMQDSVKIVKDTVVLDTLK